MAITYEARIARLERHCEMLAKKLGLTCDDLDKVWPDYQAAERNATPLPPQLKKIGA